MNDGNGIEKNEKNKEKNEMKSESVFGAICDRVSEKFDSGVSGAALTGYSREKSAFDRSAIVTAIRRSGSGNGVIRRIKKGVARTFEESLTVSVFSKIKKASLGCGVRTYGVFFTTFGIYTTLIFLIKKYALYVSDVSNSDLFCGLAMMLLALPLLFSSKSLARALGTSVLLRPVLTDACGVTPDKLAVRSRGSGAVQSWAVIAGIAAGMLTYYVSPVGFIAVLLIVLFAVILLCFPEAGVSLALLTAPLLNLTPHPSAILAAVTLLSAVGFFAKYMRGKRTAVCGPLEAAVAAFMFLTLCGGVFVSGGGDPLPAIVRTVLMAVYFLIVNTVNTRKRLATCISLLLASATLVSYIGIAEFLLGRSIYGWLDSSIFSGIPGRVTSVFANPNSLAYFIIMAFPFALAGIVLAKKRRERFLYCFSALSMLLCAVFTWSRGAWVGMAASSFVFLIALMPRAFAVVPAAVAGGSVLCMLFPDTLGARVGNLLSLSDSANYYRVKIWNGVCRMIERYFAGGIGIGEELFSSAYMRVASPEVWNASHAHSLWLGVLTELGIPGLLLLLLVLMLLTQKCVECIKLSEDKRVSVLCGAGMCGAAALVFAGFFDFVFYNYTVFFTFWAVAGLASAAADIRVREVRARNIEMISAGGDDRAADITISFN